MLAGLRVGVPGGLYTCWQLCTSPYLHLEHPRYIGSAPRIPRRGPLRHLGKLGCVRSDPYEPTSTGIGVGRGGAATQNAAQYLEH